MKVAIVGSGCSGLGATWLLNEYSDHEVHLYEAEDRAGGHANTVQFDRDDLTHKPVAVDTGFIVLNPSTYPNFLRFLQQESIPLVPTEMTFSVSRDSGAFEWAGSNLLTVFCQPKNILKLSMWRLMWDVLRFNASARKLLKSKTEDPKLSIGSYLDREGYSKSFRDDYLIPMTAAIWSTPPDACATGFPAKTLAQFMNNHHLLQLTGKPSWLTIKGGRVYVDRIISRLPESQLHLGTPVISIKNNSGPHPSIDVTLKGGKTTPYDHVIMACHSDMALKILERGGEVTPHEQHILGGFDWSSNEAVLHFDTRLMPRRRLAWSCWNYLTSTELQADGKVKANVNEVAVTYWMNDLQHISEDDHGTVLVTLNPPFEPLPETVIGRYKYDHPVLNAEAWASQRALHSIQGTRGVSYAGAWTSFGFHEDGFTSGLVAAMASPLFARPPFEIRSPHRDPGALWPSYVFDMLNMVAKFIASFLRTLLNLVQSLFCPRGGLHAKTI